MLEISLRSQRSKEIDPVLLGTMDIVVTLCINAAEACPRTPPEVRRIHWPVKDPVGARGSEEEIMAEFRRARDEIDIRIQALIRDIVSEEHER